MGNECQEPNCRHPATKVWNGRKVCDDHYNMYQEEEDRRYIGLGY